MLKVQQFIEFIQQHELFNADDKILLAVSGGKDSVVMVHLFKMAGFNFGIAHCNFNLRGVESQRDEAFVKILAQELGVQFHLARFNTNSYAETNKISIQMAARELRYQWFEELIVHENYKYVAVAHHQNDAIETVLLNLTRGTGISGMHGILPKRNNIIRPILFLGREDIDALIVANNLGYVEDSSNASNKYARNKIRLEVIPQLKMINPNLEETFAQNMLRFAETEQLLQNVVANYTAELFVQKDGFCQLSIEKIKALSPQRLLLFEMLKPYQFSGFVVDEILSSLNKGSGLKFFSNSHQITIDRGYLILSPLEIKNNNVVTIFKEGVSNLGNGLQIKFSSTTVVKYTDDKNFAYLDYNLLQFPLQIRFWKNGDSFKPLGMRNFKNLSDFFVDSKIPVPLKEQIPLIINGNGEIVWVAGLRQDERYKITTTTKKVAILELKWIVGTHT